MAKQMKKKTDTNPDETKAQRFSRLATKRVSTAIKKITLIGNLSGGGYEYTPEQIGKVETLLKGAVTATMARFDKSKSKDAGPEIVI